MRKSIYITIILCLFVSALSAQIKIGTYTFKDGSEYVGELKGKKPNGKGKTVFKSGDTYEGEYVKGKRQGEGTYSFLDGEKYVGQWFQDQQHGRGTFYFMNNNRYEGMWYADYQQGDGIMHYYNGDVYGEYDKSYNGTFTEISISPVLQFSLGKSDSLFCLFDFSSRRSFDKEFESEGQSLLLNNTGREWYFKRIALSWSHRFM